MEKEPIVRCGGCGEYLSDPRLYTEKELDDCKFGVCDNCQREANSQVITHDMALDAQDLSLEGQRY